MYLYSVKSQALQHIQYCTQFPRLFSKNQTCLSHLTLLVDSVGSSVVESCEDTHQAKINSQIQFFGSL